MQITVNLKTHAASALPAWLAGQPINKWLDVGSQSAMGQMDFGPLATAGLCTALGGDIGFGSPASKTRLLYAGAALRRINSELLLHGGGGARAWAGNDVLSLLLETDAPRWKVTRRPSPATDVWLNTYHNTLSSGGQVADPSNSYMRDGVTPNTPHAYWTLQFCDAKDSLYRIGITNTWERDSSPDGGKTVNRLDYATLQWDAPGTQLPYPIQISGDSHWIVTHPVTGLIYVALNGSRLYEFDPLANFPQGAWTLRYTDAATDYERRGAVIDPNRNIIFMFGQDAVGTPPVSRQNVALTQGLALNQSGAMAAPVQATLTGPFAASLNQPNLYWAAGMVYDPALDLFLYYQDDGFIYTIKWLSDDSYFVDRLALTGASPPAASMTYSGNPGIWNKMQYVPNLKGVVIVAGGDAVPTKFVKTAV